jgi:uncharacterized surface protein with fasciclin (FAS1) repeats
MKNPYLALATTLAASTVSLSAMAMAYSGSASATPKAHSPSVTAMVDFGPACKAVPMAGAGSFAGMTKAPVATAASHNPVLSTLVSAVEKAGLVDTLNNAKSLTVFAPDNAAFAAIPKATLSAILANKAELTKLLEYHVVAGRLSPAQLVGVHKTIEGGTVSVAGSGTSFNVNGTSQVVCGNVQTANATVYIVNSVLNPSSPPTAATDFGPACKAVPMAGAGSFAGMTKAPVATAASHNPVLSTLVSAVEKAGLVDTLNNAKSLTVFAPDNAAFAAIPKATLSAILANKAELTKLLEYHVVAGRLSPAQLVGVHKTIEGGTVSVAGSGTSFNVNGTSQVVCGNVQTANATVYIVNSVLNPAG